jgi:hypothetical protein
VALYVGGPINDTAVGATSMCSPAAMPCKHSAMDTARTRHARAPSFRGVLATSNLCFPKSPRPLLPAMVWHDPPKPRQPAPRSDASKGPSHTPAAAALFVVDPSRTGLSEVQLLRLYGLLHRYCLGFQQEVVEVCAGARHSQQLHTAVWHGFAQLWSESTQVWVPGM